MILVRRWLLSILLVGSSLVVSPQASGSPTNHETWTKADSPHIVESDYLVSPSQSLTIEAGAEVRFGEGAALMVSGVLHADGTTDEPVLFTSTSPDVKWEGIAFQASGFPNYRSTLSGAILENATHAVLVDHADASIVGNAFRDNGSAFRAINPQYDLTLEDNVFENNEMAVSGYTRNAISLSGNDFWNNEVNLLAEPEPMWDCGEDDGVWTLTSNDILRGPMNSEFFSNDIQTPPGSATSDYTVIATGNWWGTTDEDAINARMVPEIACCPAASGKEVMWKPSATEPQTSYEPFGEVPDPDDPGSMHGDPGVVTTYEFPKHGECYESVKHMRGSAYEFLASVEKVKLALRRQTSAGCSWWDHEERAFRSGGCAQSYWKHRFRVRYDKDDGSWTYRFGRELPRGRYMAWSYGLGEPTHLGRNQVAFRVR